MKDTITWPVVAMALIAAIPGIIAAWASLKNGKKADVIHELVNSRLTETLNKLNVALGEIGRLKGEAPKTVEEAKET